MWKLGLDEVERVGDWWMGRIVNGNIMQMVH